MSVCCPDCGASVDVPPHAREGRCLDCRPQPRRRHSDPRSTNWTAFLAQHNQQVTQ